MELNTDMIDLLFNNSTESRKQEIKGELYVSNNSIRKKKIKKLKKTVLTYAAFVLAGSVGLGALGVAGTLDASDEVMEEINTKYTYMNPFGEYVTEHVYSDDFRNEMNELNSFELMKLFNDTSSELRDEGLKKEAKVLEDVVERMSIDYSNTKNSHK